MRLIRILLVLLAALVVQVAPASTPAPGVAAARCGSVPDAMGLWRSGDLRGANLWQGRWGGSSNPYPGRSIGNPVTQGDLDDLRALGANYLQLSVAGLYAEQPPYAPDPEARQIVDDVVAKASKAGMFVVIAFRSGPGRNEQAIVRSGNVAVYGPIVEDFWDSATAQQAWLDMLRYAAQRYGANPAVIGIDPMVEPNDVARRGFLGAADFAARYGGTLEDVNIFNARAAAAIRSVSDVPVLVEGDGYASVPYLATVVPTGDPRSVYTAHYYEPFGYTNQEPGVGIAYPGTMPVGGAPVLVDRRFQERALAPLATFAARHGVPVAVTEFGVHRYAPGAAAYLTDTLDILDGIGASHAVWEFVVAAQRPLFNDFDVEGGPDPKTRAAVGGGLQTAVENDFARNCARPPIEVATPVEPSVLAPWEWTVVVGGILFGVAMLVAVLHRRGARSSTALHRGPVD